MTQQRPSRRGLVLLSLLVAVCCYLLVCGMAGFAWGRGMRQATTSGANPGPVANPPAALVRHAPNEAEAQTARALREAALPQRDLLDLARRLDGLDTLPDDVTVTPAPAFDPGDRLSFWVHDIAGNSFYTAAAVLRYETAHAYWWVEDGYTVDEDDLARSARRFEQETYPTVRRIFGSEVSPGLDGDPHVYLFLGDVPGVAGYFSGPDEYPFVVREHSNQHEMFYINLENAAPGTDYFDGILAHEFQHMVHWNMDRDEDTWVNEGLSELAAHVNGFDVGGTDRLFSAAPDTQLTTWPELEDSGPHYGASYLFLAYFLDQYGEDAVTQLVAEPANGAAGFGAVLSSVDPARPFDDLFADWIAANYLDDKGVAQGQYAYAELDPRRPVHGAEHTTFPATGRATVEQYAADYILLEGEGDVVVQFEGSTLVPVVGNEVHGGTYQWCAVRGDEGDATMTRAFDLSGVDRATLRAWMWYDLEVDYDYAYVEASADGGETWALLANEYTTTRDPNGSSYGPALTGTSGGGDEAQWIDARFDLTSYAGGPILVRFEVITDESINRPGLCVDDVSIPEIGFADGAEGGPNGWDAAGWLRITDRIPQGYIVQLLTFGPQTEVERMELTDHNRGRLAIEGLGDTIDRAVLVVSAVAPVTTESASYQYRIAPGRATPLFLLDPAHLLPGTLFPK